MKKKRAYQAFNFTKLLTAWSCLLDSSVFPPSLLSSQRELPEERENEHLISWRRPPSSPTLIFKNHPTRPHSAAADTKGVADQYTGCKIEHPSSESGHDKYVSIREPPSLAAPCEYCGVGWGIPLYWWGVQIPPSSDREAPSWEWFVMCFFSPIFSNGRVLEFSRQRVSLYRGKIMWVARGVISKQTCRHSRVRILITSEFLDNIKSHDCNNSKLEV